jgi:uncharacterized protein involved in high-affinity Fe2+ transport
MRLPLLGRSLIPLLILLGAGCAANPNTQPVATSVSQQSAQPSGTPNPNAQPSPIPAASIQVSPPEVPSGTVSMSLNFEPPRHMEDETRAAALSAQPVPAAQPTLMAGPPSQGAIVLADMLKVTNNLDPSQPTPPDSAQSIVRQAVVQVTTADTHQLVPYLTVTMDLLLDGHPVTFGQTLVPMFTNDGSGQRLYYGNNVRLPERGTFQAFVRLDRTPLLGQDAPPAAQFNLSVK